MASGFNLTSSVVRGGVHLIGVVMGGRTAVRRDLEMMHLLDTAFVQVDANPTLVAHRSVPWEAVADASQQPAVAGFTLPAQTANTATQFAALSAMPPPPVPETDDEDAAEARRAPDENLPALHAPAPQLASVAQPPAPVAAIPPAMVQLCALICDCAKSLTECFQALNDKQQVTDHCIEINRLEDVADGVVRRAISELFDTEKDPIALIKLKEVYEFLEATTDRCEDVANVIEGVIVKHG